MHKGKPRWAERMTCTGRSGVSMCLWTLEWCVSIVNESSNAEKRVASINRSEDLQSRPEHPMTHKVEPQCKVRVRTWVSSWFQQKIEQESFQKELACLGERDRANYYACLDSAGQMPILWQRQTLHALGGKAAVDKSYKKPATMVSVWISYIMTD